MFGAAPTPSAVTAPQERGWRWFVLGLGAMVAITAAPAWPPALALLSGAVRLLFPVEQFALLVVLAIASCALVGWWAGGRLLLAVGWVLAAAYIVWKVPFPLSGYGAFMRGWSVLVSAAFGVVCLASPGRPLLPRALAAVAVAGLVTLAAFSARAESGAGVFSAPAGMLSQEYQHRLTEALDSWRGRSSSEPWRVFARRVPEVVARASQVEAGLVSLAAPQSATAAVGGPRPAPLVLMAPALLALESLMALALGWAAYHRLSRVRIGPPLGALREVRFNDQWVWGLIVGATTLLLPTLVEWRGAGLNLIGFFGSLYALRGVGVLISLVPDRVAVWLLLALVLLVPVLGPVWVLLAVLAVAFTLGLGDTWRDFRAGANARRPSSP